MAAQPDNSPPPGPLCSDAGRFGIDAIHFSRRSRRKSKVRDENSSIIVRAVFVVWFVIFLVFFGLGGVLKIRLPIALLGATATVILMLVGYVIRRWRFVPRNAEVEDPEPNPQRRLSCVGRPSAITQYGPLVDVAFEPHLYKGFASQRTTIENRFLVPTSIAIIASGLFMFLYFRTSIIIIGNGAIACAIGLVGSLLVDFLYPTFFRVVPGRLDVMRFSTLRGRPISVERFDLRTAWVLVDLRRSVVFINEGEKHAEYAIGLMPGRTKFAHALFWAAMNTHEPPELPDDRLLG